MPKAPRDKESATPTKRTRKTTSKAGNGVHADDGNGAAAQSVSVTPEVSSGAYVSSSLEEQIRVRAYQLYLERGGSGGSPEQDWFRAQQEIHGRRSGV